MQNPTFGFRSGLGPDNLGIHMETIAAALADPEEQEIFSRLRFLRPSSETVLRYAERHFTNLRHGLLSSLAPEWIPAAADLIAQVLGRSISFGEPNFRFPFRPALDRFDGVDWDIMVQALRK